MSIKSFNKKPKVYDIKVSGYEFTALIESQDLPLGILKELYIAEHCAVEVTGDFEVYFDEKLASAQVSHADAWSDKFSIAIEDLIDLDALEDAINSTDDGSWYNDSRVAAAESMHDLYQDK